jgi:hypothetical protein
LRTQHTHPWSLLMTKMRFALLTGLLVAGGAAAYGLLQVPRLQDPPRSKVDRLTDADSDLLPVVRATNG